MDKETHGARLRTAMAGRGMTRKDLASMVNRGERTITNWTTAETLPDDTDRAKLRRIFPSYDDPGDPVEVAILGSELTDDRQFLLIGTYKRMLREQAGERDAV